MSIRFFYNHYNSKHTINTLNQVKLSETYDKLKTAQFTLPDATYDAYLLLFKQD